MRRPAVGYAGKLVALFGGLAALGSSSYFVASSISGTGAPARAAYVTPTTGTERGFATAQGSCGRERWAVKTLTDADAAGINFAPVDSTITALGSVPAPAPSPDLPRQPQERSVYRVQGTIVAFKQEADSDIHLAIADPAPGPHSTMIAEFPAPYCDTAAVDKAQIDAARQDFTAAYGQATPQFRTPAGCVTLTGVFFFDKIHGQLGVAPNGAELHPVLSFANGCRGSQAVPPSVTTTSAVTTTATTTTVPAASGTTTRTTPAAAHGCRRHWYRHVYHKQCRPYYFTSP